jgi:hypothetical protein
LDRVERAIESRRLVRHLSACWFEEQEKDPPKPLEEGAKQIISLVSALFSVVSGFWRWRILHCWRI